MSWGPSTRRHLVLCLSLPPGIPARAAPSFKLGLPVRPAARSALVVSLLLQGLRGPCWQTEAGRPGPGRGQVGARRPLVSPPRSSSLGFSPPLDTGWAGLELEVRY